ncbi:MAG: hypothetical protein IPH44_22140 [Myxococcales bacterium]|nr:hypothetical protein [Myxococcales bacterium]
MRTALALAALGLVVSCKGRDAPSSSPAARPDGAASVAPSPRCSPGARTCVADAVVACRADGTPGAQVEACAAGCRDGACVDTCAVQDVELVYVVDSDAILYAFDPRKLPGDAFRKIAALGCDPSRSVNSMAVDRRGVAWLGYQNGRVHRASIIDGSCVGRGGAPAGAPQTFGMGFVTDGPKATTETLFVAAGAFGTRTKTLARLDTAQLPPTWRPVATLETDGHHPELTGTGDGRLFAYFPAPGRGRVQELDRSTAAPIGAPWVLGDAADAVEAYAFAHWGGTFYVFTTVGGVSSVHAVPMQAGAPARTATDLPMRIVGAGVSTCAPLLERAP